MPERDGGPIKIDDVVIDSETGEILEMPPGFSGDQLEWFVVRARQAREQEQTWKAAGGYFRKVIGGLLTQAGEKTIRTQHGIASWRGRQNRKADPARLEGVAAEYELDADAVTSILSTAKTLDVKRLDELKAIIDPEAIDALITEDPTEWVQVDAPRLAAPKIEKGEG